MAAYDGKYAILGRWHNHRSFNGDVRFGSWLCENSAEIAPLKKVNEFSRPQADQKEENSERKG